MSRPLYWISLCFATSFCNKPDLAEATSNYGETLLKTKKRYAIILYIHLPGNAHRKGSEKEEEAMVKNKTKNLSLDFMKLVAACFVVFIHIPFPYPLSLAVTSVARFAVPFFFAVSGYYSLGIGTVKIKKRVVRNLQLHLVAAVLCLATGSLIQYCSEGTVGAVLNYLRTSALPNIYQIVQWILLQSNPYGGQLWYLSSLLLCYLVLWGYTLFWEGEKQDNKPLYYAGFSLLAVYFTMSNLLLVEGVAPPYRAYTNGWLAGIPMFTMGMFLHEYEERLITRFSLTSGKMWFLIVLGILMSLIQGFAGYEAEIPFGMYLVVPALLLFLVRNPEIPIHNSWIQAFVSRLGVVSMAVYILHIPIIDLYNRFLQDWAYGLAATREPLLRPVIVLILSLLAAFLWERVDWLLTRKK